MKIDNFLRSRELKTVIATLVVVIVIFGIFKAGMIVGYHKAFVSYRWKGSDFADGGKGSWKGRFMHEVYDKDFIGAHGVFGKIVKIDPATLTIKNRLGEERVILIDTTTVIKRFQKQIQLNDLAIDDPITVIGDPDDVGQIKAKFITFMPRRGGDTRGR